MIRFKKETKPTMLNEKQSDNRFSQINEAAAEKRKKVESDVHSDDHSPDKKATE